MAGSIKLFPLFQKIHHTFGMHPSQSQSRQKPYLSTESIRAVFIICALQCIISMIIFFVSKANSMFEFGMLFCMILSATIAICVYLIFIWQSGNTLKSIKNCEKFIEKSKYRQFISKFTQIAVHTKQKIHICIRYCIQYTSIFVYRW